MSNTQRLVSWNHWYDRVPEELRYQFVLWPLLALGAINMMLTIASGFPFGLLLLLGIIVVAAIRVPYLAGWLALNAGEALEPGPIQFRITAAGWVHRVNLWYEGLPEFSRGWVILAVLGTAGALNMILTLSNGFPFGLLFLLALLALIAIRGPHVAGWLAPPAISVPAAAVPPPPEPAHVAPPEALAEPPPHDTAE